MSAMEGPLTKGDHHVSGEFPVDADQETVELVADGNLRTWPISKILLEEPITIPVMGITGSGKSSLIERFGAEAEYARDDGIRLPDVGHMMTSETKDICAYRLYRDCRKIIFVDTPGFSDADMEDAKTLAIFATWLATYKHIAGMIWLQPIDDDKFDRQSKRNQKLFEAITGESNIPIVSLVTTKWSRSHGSRAALREYMERETSLKGIWKHLLDKKAQTLRDDHTDLLDLILEHSTGDSPLALQEELVKPGCTLADTTSGKILSEDFKTDLVEEHIDKLLDQIQIDRENNTPNDLLMSEARSAYDAYVGKREAKQLLEEWTFNSMMKWVNLPAMGVGVGTFGLVALEEGLTAALLLGGTAIGVVAALATAGIAVGVVGTALLYQRVTRKPLPETELDAKVRECLGFQSPVRSDEPTEVHTKASGVFGETFIGRSKDRLARPTQYAKHLEELEQELFRQSVVSHCFVSPDGQSVEVSPTGEDPDDAHGETVRRTKAPSASVSPLLSSPRSFRDLLKTASDLRSSTLHQQEQELYHLTECCLVAQRILYNLVRLKEAGFVADQISVVVADPQRSNIAQLKDIKMQTVHELLKRFIETLTSITATKQLDHSILDLTCRRFMADDAFGLLPAAGDAKLVEPTSLWRSTIHLLDASVLLYAGAHTMSYGEDDTLIRVPGHFQCTDGQQYIIARRRLGCLHDYLGARVWTIHSSEFDDGVQLALAAKADTLADIWGPMSAERIDMVTDAGLDTTSTGATHNGIVRYCLGAGHVVPWNEDGLLPLHDNEVYCHWLPEFKTDDSMVEYSLVPTNARFTGKETLVIGSRLPMQLLVNNKCGCLATRDDRRRGLPGSIPLQFQPEARTRQAQLGVSHIVVTNFVVNHQYKRVEGSGNTYKQILFNTWSKDDGAFDPAALSLHHGVEFSKCTENARRVPLGSIVVSKYMERFFDVSGNAEMHTEVKNRRDEANILQQLWKDHEEWRSDIVKGVRACLGVLQGTGQTSQGDFIALYVPVDESKVAHQRMIPSDEGLDTQNKAALQTSLNLETKPKNLVRVNGGEWTEEYDLPGQKYTFKLQDGRRSKGSKGHTHGYLRHVELRRDNETDLIGLRTKWETPGFRNRLPWVGVVKATEANGEDSEPPLRMIIEAE